MINRIQIIVILSLVSFLFATPNTKTNEEYWISYAKEEYVPNYIFKLSKQSNSEVNGEILAVLNKTLLFQKKIIKVEIKNDSIFMKANIGMPVDLVGNINDKQINGELSFADGMKIPITFEKITKEELYNNFPEVDESKFKSYKYVIPNEVNTGFAKGNLLEANINNEILYDVLTRIKKKNHGLVDAFILVKDGKLLVEEYFNDYNRNKIHFISSNTKTVSALVMAIALERGDVESITEPVIKYFPEYPELKNEKINLITIEHLLKMQAGFDPGNYFFQPGKDFFRLTLDRPIINEPGTVCLYDNAVPNLYAKIIYEATGKHIDKYAEDVLFNPLGVSNYDWEMDKYNGYPVCQGTLQIPPIEMAKIGNLILTGGKWDGKQIISEKWINNMIKKHSVIDEKAGVFYGMTWWIAQMKAGGKNIEVIYMGGSGGQFVFVIPELNAVLVFSGSNFDTMLHFEIFEILEKELLPALVCNK